MSSPSFDSNSNVRSDGPPLACFIWPILVLAVLFGVGWQWLPKLSPQIETSNKAFWAASNSNPFSGTTILKDLPGQQELSIFKRDEVRVPPTAIVLGVLVEGSARAYLADGMSRPEWHLAHDLLAGRPVTISYCNWTDCVSVFERNGTAASAIRMGGFRKGHLQVLLDGVAFDQTSDKLPLSKLPFKKMTWSEWQALHPSTDIFLGDKVGEFALSALKGKSKN